MWGHDQPSVEPPLARPVGAQQLGDRLYRRLDRQHIKPSRRNVAIPEQRRQCIEIDYRPAGGVDDDRTSTQQSELGMAEHAAGFRRERGMDGQGIGLPQQVFEAAGAGDTESEFGAVWQIRIKEHHAKAKGPRPQRNGRANAPEPEDAEGLDAKAPDQLALHGSPESW